MPTKPGGCNRSHIPKVLEQHPTDLPNPQPSHKPPAPGPLQAPVTLEPDSSVREKTAGKRGVREGTPKTTKLL